MASPSTRIAGEELEFSEVSSASVLLRRSGSGKLASSCPGVGFYMAAKRGDNLETMPANSVRTLGTNKPAGATGDVSFLVGGLCKRNGEDMGHLFTPCLPSLEKKAEHYGSMALATFSKLI